MCVSTDARRGVRGAAGAVTPGGPAAQGAQSEVGSKRSAPGLVRWPTAQRRKPPRPRRRGASCGTPSFFIKYSILVYTPYMSIIIPYGWIPHKIYRYPIPGRYIALYSVSQRIRYRSRVSPHLSRVNLACGPWIGAPCRVTFARQSHGVFLVSGCF